MEEAKTRLESWLRGELERADVDADVYVPYVAEFLADGGAFDAAGAAEVLAAVMDEGAATALAQRVGAQWRTEAAAGASAAAGPDASADAGCLAAEVCERLRLAQAEAEAAAAAAPAAPGAEVVADSAERARLVALYGAVVTEAEPAPGTVPPGAAGKRGRGDRGAGAAAGAAAGTAEHLGGNVNHGAAQAAAERQRAEMKAAHEAKVEQDRKSREKQRLTRDEKKAQRRAACQKGERRR